MDPNTAWDSMLMAYATKQWADALRYAQALNDWLDGGGLLSRDTTKSGEGVELDLMTPTALLSQKDGARCNGIHSDRFDCVAVGAGSIGSHVLEQLVRSGHGRWTTIDDDILLPHNVARHVLTGWAIGIPKAEALSHHLNSIYEDDPTRAIIANVIHDQSDELDDVFREAEGIVDLSASVAVSRKLAIDVESDGRRITSFFVTFRTGLRFVGRTGRPFASTRSD